MIKRQLFLVMVLLLIVRPVNSQQIKVLTLGTFHFAFHNMDIKKIDDEDQIDVLSKKYQKEIEEIVAKLADFKPTKIAIEVDPEKQFKIDSLYKQYLLGKHVLNREEYQQIGFRLAKRFNLNTLYCVNDWGKLPDKIQNLVYGPESNEKKKFMDFFYNNPDSSKLYYPDDVFKTEGILKHLKRSNSEECLKKDLGNYLLSIFKYETNDDEFLGVDFTTGWWFNRNLRIFRNIQKIPTKTDDRILVIYGVGHMNILNILFDTSPEYELKRVNEYLNN